MKGLLKGIKHITSIFAHKEHELEIGYPTDVKHVSHIGWDGGHMAPSWMREYKTSSDFSSAASSWASLDFKLSDLSQPREPQLAYDSPTKVACRDLPKGPKKEKRRKPKTPSPSHASSKASERSSVSRCSFSTAMDSFEEC